MYNVNDVTEFSLNAKNLAKDIIGEVVLADKPENVLKKWRTIFKISQKALAAELVMTSSVISDYESGRRKSPGIKMINKYVNALIKIDAKNGGQVIRSFSKPHANESISDAVIDIKEFSEGKNLGDFCKRINATLATKSGANQTVYGYTIIDSLKAITELSFSELIKLYGVTSQRALIFTKVSTGRTPMVAIKLTNLHPSLVVLHGLSSVDDVAKRIAEVENIPLAVCRLNSVDDIKEQLKLFD
ncbi:MAG: transcriptional regulator [Candidatus Aenigmatarchaeota archaeon]|nr:MAG: transcriptional regulator [Candidatus Aenigmarchaeota archaeon]